ncbi:MAG: radical SAM protein [Chloroflexi bacterium]|nr:radical SAM protein [Chloroflexota bacterium]
MHIGLISPRGSERNQQDNMILEISEILSDNCVFMMDDVERIPNLALLSLAALAPDDVEFTFIEEDYVPLDKVEETIFAPGFDLACLTATNYQANRAYYLGDELRKRGVPVIIGGLHPSALPDEAAEHADSVAIGEGEDIFPIILEDFRNNELKPFYKSSGNVDLAALPPPRYDLIKHPEYFNKMPVVATRGCPYNCDFCIFPKVYGRKLRKKTVPQVIREIEIIKRIMPDPYIHFCDENMLVDSKYAKELVRALIPHKIEWECFCDIAVADDEELLDLLVESGCRDLLIGLESIDPDVLKNVDAWKSKQLEKYPERIRKIQRHDLSVTGLFIVGFDEDTPDIFKRMRNFIFRSGLLDMDFAILTPMPGTGLYSRLKAEGRILTEDWSRYTWQHVNFMPKNMSPDELQRGLLWLFSQFSRPELIMQREDAAGPSRPRTH